MSKKDTDISQLRQYFNGELDAGAMHRLERQALDDPFLMDAMEGYEKAGGDQQAQLQELTSRLQLRIEPKQRRLIPWKLIAAAAAVIIAFTLCWIWFSADRASRPAPVAKLTLPMVKPSPARAGTEQPAPVKRQEIASLRSARHKRLLPVTKTTRPHPSSNGIPVIAGEKHIGADAVASAPVKDTSVMDTTPMDEMVVMDYNAKKKKDSTSVMATAKRIEVKKAPVNNSGQILTSRVDGVTTSPNTNQSLATGRVNTGAATGLILDQVAANNMIRGRVIAQDDRQPIPNVSVHVKGTKTSAITDTEGNFVLKADSNKARLVIASPGYLQTEVSARNKDSLSTITLHPGSNSLAEVVVASPSPQAAADKTATPTAHPTTGWENFKKYLAENAVSPDATKGVVELSLTIDAAGKVTKIDVTKNLSPACDQKAIDLIKNGPAWVPGSDGKAEAVKVSVEFSK